MLYNAQEKGTDGGDENEYESAQQANHVESVMVVVIDVVAASALHIALQNAQICCKKLRAANATCSICINSADTSITVATNCNLLISGESGANIMPP